MAVKEASSNKAEPEKTKKVKGRKISEDKWLKVKLVRSVIGRPQKQREVVRGIGLRKLNSEVIRKDCPETWGMIRKIQHLLRVEVMDKK